MRDFLTRLDGLNRRRFVEYAAKSALGVSLMPTLNTAVEAAKAPVGAG